MLGVAQQKHHLCFNCLKGGHFTTSAYPGTNVRNIDACITLSHSPLPSMKFVVEMDLPHLQQQPHWVVLPSHHKLCLMQCRIAVLFSEEGSAVKARALLNDGSFALFISERLASGLQLRSSKQRMGISGVTGMTTDTQYKTIANFRISSIYPT